MRARPVLALTSIGLVLTVAAVSASSVPAAQQATNDGAIHSDFNGDGFDDLTVASPSERTSDGAAQAGIVHVLYGGPNGLIGEGSQLFDQGSPGMAGDPEERDFLGLSLAAGDFDGDTLADLAIGVPREDLNGKADAGLVQILYGSTGGLVATEYFTYANTTGEGTCTCRFGEALAAGDFNEDDVADLAIGAPLTPKRSFLETGNLLGRESGEVLVLYGKRGADGLRANGSTRLRPHESWAHNFMEVYGWTIDFLEFGASLAAGDRNGDGDSDLAVGIPGHGLGGLTPGAEPEEGAFSIFDGSAEGVSTSAVTGGDLNVGFVARGADHDETGERFAESLAFGDFDGDGKEELVVGAPREEVASREEAGAVYVYKGRNLVKRWIQSYLSGAQSDSDDLFGYSLRVGDFDGNGRDDLAIGVPFENFSGSTNAGIVHVLMGSASGLRATGAKIFHQDKPDIAGAVESGDTFALALGVGNFNGDIQGTRGRDELAIGVPGEEVSGKARAGLVHVLFGSSSGVTATGSQTWTQDSPGLANQVGIGDSFGGSLP